MFCFVLRWLQHAVVRKDRLFLAVTDSYWSLNSSGCSPFSFSLFLQVGSMLKTPRFPVWVCCINNSYSVLFSLNRSLLSDWRMEHQFQLFYCNGQNSQRSTARLTVGERHRRRRLIQLLKALQVHEGSGSPADTHSHHWEAPPAEADPEKRFPSLEMTIRTKWDGAAIDWNGTDPFY